jgi:hypothetical protein
MMYRVILRGTQYFVVNRQGVTRAGPYSSRRQAQALADRLNRGKRA